MRSEIHLPLLEEMPLYGGLPKTTITGVSRLTRFASLASAESQLAKSVPVSGWLSSRLSVRKTRKRSALDPRQLITRFGQQQIDLQMRHGVTCHEQLKTVEARQKVAFHIAVPDAFLPHKILMNVFDNFRQKCAGSGGGIKDLHFVHFALFGKVLLRFLIEGLRGNFDGGFAGIRQSFRKAKLAFEDVVHGTHDEAHNGRRRVPNAARLTQFGVVFAEECFVKMNNGIFGSGGFAVFLENLSDIAGQKNFRQAVHHPFDAVINIGSGECAQIACAKRD